MATISTQSRVGAPPPRPLLAWPLTARCASSRSRRREVGRCAGDLQLLVEEDDRPLYRHRTQAADSGFVGMVEEPEQQQHRELVVTTVPMRSAWTTERSPLSAKNSM